MTNNANWIRFFEKTFLVANVSPKVVFKMLFLTLSSANIDFLDRKLWWRTYTTKEVLLITSRIELVGKKEFATAALDPEHEIFVVYVAFFSSTLLDVHLFRRPQISSLIAEEIPIKIPNKYVDIADVFSLDLASEFPKYTGINKHIIELVDN